MIEIARPLAEGVGPLPAAEEMKFQAKLLRKFANDIDSIMFKEKAAKDLQSKQWLAVAKDILSMVAKVGSEMLPFLEQYPALSASAYNTLVNGGAVAVSVISLGVLAYRLLGAGVRSSVVNTRVLVVETFFYLCERLPQLDQRVNLLDGLVLPIKTAARDGNTTELNGLLEQFREIVRLCRLDIDECIAKLAKLKPALDKCIRQLNCTMLVTSSFSGMFGAVGVGSIAFPGFGLNKWAVAGACSVPTFILGKLALDCVKLKHYFVEHQAMCDSINHDLEEVNIRLNSHVETLQQAGIGL